MKPMKTKLMGAFVGVHGLMISAAMAHEGPPGHTHGEEWPFGPLMLGLGVIVAVAVLRKMRSTAG